MYVLISVGLPDGFGYLVASTMLRGTLVVLTACLARFSDLLPYLAAPTATAEQNSLLNILLPTSCCVCSYWQAAEQVHRHLSNHRCFDVIIEIQTAECRFKVP